MTSEVGELPAPRHRLDGATKIVLALAAAALVTTLAAVLALGARATRESAAFAPRLLFPEIAEKLDAGEFAGLTLETKEGKVVVARSADGRWVLPEKGGYPVAEGPLVSAVATLAGLTLAEAKTQNPERHGLLGLVPPSEGGEARALTLTDKAGAPIAAVLLGEEPLRGEIGRRRAVYVRKPGERATYLAYTELALESDLSAWLATDGLTLPRERVASVAVTPSEGLAYVVRKQDGEEGAFVLEGLGPEEEVTSAYALSGLAGALGSLGIDDVAKAETVDLSKAARLVYTTGDGLAVTAAVVRMDDAAWLTLSPRALPDAKEEVAKEAEALAARASGWAFKIPASKADQMTKARADLVRPKTKPEESEAGEGVEDGAQSHARPPEGDAPGAAP